MRGKSHIHLGRYLAQRYMENIPEQYFKAFLVGCIQPDRNPATYLKGSLRCQWLRGHNYQNARRFMRKISHRLERKENLKIFDYYTLGKLIHYTADAFTYAHNSTFPTDLEEHREYEAALQDHFLEYLQADPQVDTRMARSVMDAIYSYHREYIAHPADIRRDAQFALTACCCVLAILLTPRII